MKVLTEAQAKALVQTYFPDSDIEVEKSQDPCWPDMLIIKAQSPEGLRFIHYFPETETWYCYKIDGSPRSHRYGEGNALALGAAVAESEKDWGYVA